MVEWLTAERGQLFVIPSSSLFHVHPGEARSERRAWGFALDHAFRILGGWMEDNAKAAMEGELKAGLRASKKAFNSLRADLAARHRGASDRSTRQRRRRLFGEDEGEGEGEGEGTSTPAPT